MKNWLFLALLVGATGCGKGIGTLPQLPSKSEKPRLILPAPTQEPKDKLSALKLLELDLKTLVVEIVDETKTKKLVHEGAGEVLAVDGFLETSQFFSDHNVDLTSKVSCTGTTEDVKDLALNSSLSVKSISDEITMPASRTAIFLLDDKGQTTLVCMKDTVTEFTLEEIRQALRSIISIHTDNQ